MRCQLWGGCPEGHYTREVGDTHSEEESLPHPSVFERCPCLRRDPNNGEICSACETRIDGKPSLESLPGGLGHRHHATDRPRPSMGSAPLPSKGESL